MPRCPKGTRKNKKSGDCEPYDNKKENNKSVKNNTKVKAKVKEKEKEKDKDKVKDKDKEKDKEKATSKRKKIILEDDIVCDDLSRYSKTCNQMLVISIKGTETFKLYSRVHLKDLQHLDFFLCSIT